MLMKDVACKFSKPGQMGLDALAGTICTAKMVLLLGKYNRFVGCDKHVYYLQNSMPSLVEVFGFQLRDTSLI